METPITNPPIFDQIKQYLETQFKLVKLEGIDKASAIFAEIIADLLMVVLFLLTFILLSITVALFLGHLLKSNWEGFAFVTICYLIITIAARLLKINLQNLFVRRFIQWVFKNI